MNMKTYFKHASIVLFLVFGSIFLLQPSLKLQAQTMSCPEYIIHFKQVNKIKWCGGYFTAWSVCEFYAGGMCPCMDETEPAC